MAPEKTSGHIPIKHRHRHEHRRAHESVQEIHRPNPILLRLLRPELHRSVDDPYPSERRHSVPDLPPLVLHAVDEVHQEARDSGDGDQAERSDPVVDRVAVAAVGEDRGEHLEDQNGAGWEEIGEAEAAFEAPCLY